jgi:hypothetical protein
MGHIAAMTEEKSMTSRGQVYGFLVECNSIAGLSGSPVFWMHETLQMRDGIPIQRRGYLAIGIVLGYHVVETKEDEILVPQFQNDELTSSAGQRGMEERRTGFAVILPISYAHQIVESEIFMNRSIEAFEEFRKKGPNFHDASAAPKTATDASPAIDVNPNHQEDFNRLLNQAAKKREQD